VRTARDPKGETVNRFKRHPATGDKVRDLLDDKRTAELNGTVLAVHGSSLVVQWGGWSGPLTYRYDHEVELVSVPPAPTSEQIEVRAGGEEDRSVDELIEASSLGTPEAKALREQTPAEVVERIMRKIAERGGALPTPAEAAQDLHEAGQRRAAERAENVRRLRRDG
jgi:hypothetical protein